MIIKGEKYACEACVRGHRVSNCQHSDRPLQHINKKGRPVSQCTHCRTLRKSRAAHVRCECGEKAHSKSACSHEENTLADTCCCSHGGRCSCSLKKEHLDPVPESDSDESTPALVPTADVRRPRAHTEGGLTIFTNGHHKPVHKHNTMAHKCGLPYVVPRSHSIHGPSPSGLANRSVDNLPHTSTIDALHSESHIKDSMVSAQQEQRMVKSEHGSPHINAVSNLDQLNGMLPSLDISSFPADYDFLQNTDSFTGLSDHDLPLFSAGLTSASVDWSHYDGLDFNNDDFAASSYSQAASYNGFDFSGIEQPALTTTSTSGEISEVEDFPAFDGTVPRPSLVNNQYGSDFDTSDLGDIEGYRLSTASSYIGLPQTQILADNDIGGLDMDSFLKAEGYISNPNQGLRSAAYNETKNVQDVVDFDDTTFLPVSAEEETDVFWMNDFDTSIPMNQPRSEPQVENIWAAQ